MLSFLLDLCRSKKIICNICNYHIKSDEKISSCKKCSNKMHKSCYLNKNGIRPYCGCSNCIIIKGFLINKND
jgi:hypothetical protein